MRTSFSTAALTLVQRFPRPILYPFGLAIALVLASNIIAFSDRWYINEEGSLDLLCFLLLMSATITGFYVLLSTFIYLVRWRPKRAVLAGLTGVALIAFAFNRQVPVIFSVLYIQGIMNGCGSKYLSDSLSVCSQFLRYPQLYFIIKDKSDDMMQPPETWGRIKRLSALDQSGRQASILDCQVGSSMALNDHRYFVIVYCE